MDEHLVLVEKWIVTCRPNEHVTETFVLAGDTYGRLLGRTTSGEIVLFESWADPVFDQVAEIVGIFIKGEPKRSVCFRQILGMMCDLSQSGDHYDFSGAKKCSVCGSSNVAYGPCTPPIVFQFPIKPVTHHRWNHLTNEQKLALIQEALKQTDYV